MIVIMVIAFGIVGLGINTLREYTDDSAWASCLAWILFPFAIIAVFGVLAALTGV